MDRGGRIRGRGRLMGIGGFALVALLAVFHGGLLWHRLTDGSLLQPVVVARWAVSALLVVALLRLWRSGLPLLRGRRAGVLWLIVALLHAFTPGAPLPAVEPLAQGMLPAALAMLALLVCGMAVAPQGGARADRRLTAGERRGPRRSGAGWYRVLFSRPPPAALHP